MPTSKKLASGRPLARVADLPAASPEVRVLRQFRMVFNAVKTHFRQVEKTAGLGGAQLWALSVLQAAPGIGINDLAKELDVHQSTASNLVKALIERGLVEANKIGSDRRMVTLHLLPKAQRLLRKAPVPFTGVLPDALASLDAPTLARLEKDLNKLIGVLAPDQGAAKTPLAEL
jgi:MarR family transcriptional regulator, organic hydroperoxide resistance regulator